MAEEKRRHKRLVVNLPVQVYIGQGEVQDLEVVDISSSGMRLQSSDFETIKSGFDSETNRASFEILIPARLAWVQNMPDGSFLTGWEFAFDRTPSERGVPPENDVKGKRRHRRMPIDLPVHALVSDGTYQATAVVDISPTGMQMQCGDFDAIKAGVEARTQRARFRIRVAGRLAWAQNGENGTYLTGWEFDAATFPGLGGEG